MKNATCEFFNNSSNLRNPKMHSAHITVYLILRKGKEAAAMLDSY